MVRIPIQAPQLVHRAVARHPRHVCPQRRLVPEAAPSQGLEQLAVHHLAEIVRIVAEHGESGVDLLTDPSIDQGHGRGPPLEVIMDEVRPRRPSRCAHLHRRLRSPLHTREDTVIRAEGFFSIALGRSMHEAAGVVTAGAAHELDHFGQGAAIHQLQASCSKRRPGKPWKEEVRARTHAVWPRSTSAGQLEDCRHARSILVGRPCLIEEQRLSEPRVHVQNRETDGGRFGAPHADADVRPVDP